MERKTNSKKAKQCISIRSIFTLVQNFNERKEIGDVFQKYHRNLNISQITVWVCRGKKYYAMYMIISCQSKFNFLSFKSSKFDLNHEILLIRRLLNIDTYLKTCCIILQNTFLAPK